jgi:hypothetical protein
MEGSMKMEWSGKNSQKDGFNDRDE